VIPDPEITVLIKIAEFWVIFDTFSDWVVVVAAGAGSSLLIFDPPRI
jgi:hypothetical protein